MIQRRILRVSQMNIRAHGASQIRMFSFGEKVTFRKSIGEGSTIQKDVDWEPNWNDRMKYIGGPLAIVGVLVFFNNYRVDGEHLTYESENNCKEIWTVEESDTVSAEKNKMKRWTNTSINTHTHRRSEQYAKNKYQ